MAAANIALAQKQTDRVEVLYKLGVESASKAGSTDIDKNIGYLETAIKHFTEALKIEPRNLKILLQRGEIYLELYEFEKAIADFSQVIKLNPNYILAYKSRAKAFRAIGKIAEAEADEKRLKP